MKKYISKLMKNIFFEFYDKKVRSEQLTIIAKSNLLKEVTPPFLISFSIYIIVSGFVILLLWSSFTSVKEVVRAEGKIVPVGEVKKIQHLDGGLISEILVSDGDHVSENQVLIVLKNNSAKADIERFKSNALTIAMDIERFSAFVEKRVPNFRIISSVDPTVISEQELLFDAMKKTFIDEQKILRNQLEQKLDYLNTLKSKKDNTFKSYKVSKEYYLHQKNLYSKRLVSKSDYLSAKKEKINHYGRYSDLKTEMIQAKNSIKEFQSRLSSLELSTFEKSLQKLDTLKREEKENNKNLKKVSSQIERLYVRSPVSGFIKGSEANTLGAVVVPGRTILEVVPSNTPLEIQLKVSPKDIGQIDVGSVGLIKVSAFDFSRFGSIDSIVNSVSASSFEDEKFGVHYKVKMRPLKNYVGNNPFINKIQAGMTVEGNIFVGEKTILSYLLKPIHNSLNTAFTEK
jgi:HlyD family secretion protein/adhesin transport system membrane fusion protein